MTSCIASPSVSLPITGFAARLLVNKGPSPRGAARLRRTGVERDDRTTR